MFFGWVLGFSQVTEVWLGFLCQPVPVPILLPSPVARLYVDASLQGWGAHDQDQVLFAQGLWGQRKSKLHINHLELLAVRLSLQDLQDRLPRGHTQIISDNMTVVLTLQLSPKSQKTCSYGQISSTSKMWKSIFNCFPQEN